MSRSGRGRRGVDDDDGDSMGTAIGVAAAAGAALLWGFSKLMSSGQEEKDKELVPPLNTSSNSSDSYYAPAGYPTTVRSPSPVKIQAPKFYKLNFDGAESNQAKKAGAGCIIRDIDTGKPIVAAYYNLDFLYPDCNIAIVEAMALKKGLELANVTGIQVSLVEGDSNEIVNRVNGQIKRPSTFARVNRVLLEIESLMDQYRIAPKFMLISREANTVADHLAHLGSQKGGQCWVYEENDVLPAKVIELLAKDQERMGSSSNYYY